MSKKKDNATIKGIEKDLKKALAKKRDPFQAELARKLINELAKEDADKVIAYLCEITKKHNAYADRLATAISEIEDCSLFTETEIQAIIDYCFRYGSGAIQRVGVVILRQYKGVGNLRARYQLVFLKDKAAAKYLIREVYSD